MSNQPWYTYPIVVPFGDPNYDSQMGGSHDLDVGAPANYPVTALLAGNVSSITSPPWGKQVGIRLVSPYNGIPFLAFLHLSAVNPSLRVGSRVVKNDLIGWVGGASDPSQYAGTSNPTGQNFLNDPSQSSRVQVGMALMNGPEYGVGSGWEQWQTNPSITHFDSPLNPTSIIKTAVALYTAQRKAFEIEWTIEQPAARLDSGIANQAWEDYQAGRFHGPATSLEYTNDEDWGGNPIQASQNCHMGTYHWVNGVAVYYPYR